MPTPPRNFKKQVPYLLTQRFSGGVQLLDSRKLRRQLMRQIVLAARRAKVVVLAYFIFGNHVHFVLVQRRSGAWHKTEGIAPFMRNVFGVFCRQVNQRHEARKRGHVVQARYDHQELAGLAGALRALAYVHGQRRHHGLSHLEDEAARSSWGVVNGRPDGVVTAEIEHGLTSEQLQALLLGTIDTACEREQQANPGPNVWHRALEETIARLGRERVLPAAWDPTQPCLTLSPIRGSDHDRERDRRLREGPLGRDFRIEQHRDGNERIRALTAWCGEPGEEEAAWIDYRPRRDPPSPRA